MDGEEGCTTLLVHRSPLDGIKMTVMLSCLLCNFYHHNKSTRHVPVNSPLAATVSFSPAVDNNYPSIPGNLKHSLAKQTERENMN